MKYLEKYVIGFKKLLPGGKVVVTTNTCKKLDTYFNLIEKCGGLQNVRYKCQAQSASCRYTTFCNAFIPQTYGYVPAGIASTEGHKSDDTIDVTCYYKHSFTNVYCCDILCSN